MNVHIYIIYYEKTPVISAYFGNLWLLILRKVLSDTTVTPYMPKWTDNTFFL